LFVYVEFIAFVGNAGASEHLLPILIDQLNLLTVFKTAWDNLSGICNYKIL